MKKKTQHKANFTPEERKLVLDLIQESMRTADPDYVADTAGFWLERKAPAQQRCFSN